MGTLRIGDTIITPSSIQGVHTEKLTVTQSGTYELPTGVTGFNKVEVNVAGAVSVVNATNDTGAALSENAKVWLNKVDGVYHAVLFAQATESTIVGMVKEGAASGGTAKVYVMNA